MDITYTTIPGIGTGAAHHCDTRQGDHFGVIVTGAGRRTHPFYDHTDPETDGHVGQPTGSPAGGPPRRGRGALDHIGGPTTG
ncbi:hypothetical protein [Spongiactinospora rosea]|uniref:hypothetical protein n=1 Tax=Spongiactinospora rosea TaxID=2248750 RepID=UPI0011C027C7|nr:hypothetical protein [Spongiactinospora rosea]